MVGAKALNLAELMRAGMPVPDGFCVTADAYRAHISALSLDPQRRALSDRDQRGQHLAAIREAITAGEMAKDTAAGIRTAFKNLRTPLVAVRSSGTAEDLPGHSFAGLYDTYLRSTDADGCIELVKQCWASLWTERAFDYREQNKFAHEQAAMAVIVQQLVAADAAGVVFTADPVSGNPERITVESCWGLGETLVSGRVTPDRFVVRRDTEQVVERSVSTKSVETVFSPTGTSVEQPVPSYRDDKPSISDATARELALLALRIERVFGTPQDVEWAKAGPNLFVLQSRPITTIVPPKSWEDRQVWSTTNAAEVLPGVLTPMVWSTVGEYVGKLLAASSTALVFPWPVPALRQHRRPPYMNLNTFTGMVRRMPFANRMGQAQMFGGQNLKTEDRANLELGRTTCPTSRSSAQDYPQAARIHVLDSPHGPKRGRDWTPSRPHTKEGAS